MYWLLVPIIGIIIICIFSGLCIDDGKIDWDDLPYFIIALFINLFCLFWGVHELQQKAIHDFEAGKYRKEITYKARQIEDHPIIYDSTVVYKLK